MRSDAQAVKRNFSKIDQSGTDPNRYASVSNAEEAQDYMSEIQNDYLIPGLPINVSTLERIAMVAAGSFLLYKGLTGKKVSIPKSLVGGTLLFRGISGYCPVYDVMESKFSAENVTIQTSVTVNKPVQKVYEFWRNLENLPLFMSHIESVKETNGIQSEWTAQGPQGIGKISWTSEILMDEPGKVLSWHSLPGSSIDNAGKINFRTTENGDTEVDVTLSYRAPFGIAGEAAAKLLNPVFEKMVKHDIEQFKDYMTPENATHGN